MKNIKKHSIILLFVTIAILFFVLKDDFFNITNELLRMNLIWLLLAIVIIVFYWLFKALSTFIIARHYSKKIKLFTLFKQTIITQFFNGITPFCTGGQPMQVYMLNKNNISLSNSTNIIIQDFIVYQIAVVLYGIFAIIMNLKFNFFTNTVFLKKLVVIGFVINISICIGVFILCFSKKVSTSILNFVIWIGEKIRIVKHKENILKKGNEKILEFQESAKLYVKNKRLLTTGILVNIVALTLLYIIPLILYKGIGVNANVSVLTIIVSSAYVLIVGAFVPIPGGSGGIEFAFLKFFGNFFFNSELGALLLIWRFITYYLGVITGAILFNFYKAGD